MIVPKLSSIILLLVITITSIIGWYWNGTISNNYEDTLCSAGIFLDDLVNGNVSYYNHNNNGDNNSRVEFFSGIKTIDIELISLNENIDKLNK